MTKMTMHRIPLEKMREHLSARQVVDSNDLDIVALRSDPSHAAPNAPEAINSDFRRHSFDSLRAATRCEYAAGERGT
jgi:hypothetical protein